MRSFRLPGAARVALTALALVALAHAGPADARGPRHGAPDGSAASTELRADWHSGWVAVRELPREAREVLERIHAGGPFAYERDGVVFGNRERLLPARPRGYYREYTVRTPGERTRGARRIVCGGVPTTPELCFYTDDHYRSFRAIREASP
jgi:ribonuclease T1